MLDTEFLPNCVLRMPTTPGKEHNSEAGHISSLLGLSGWSK